MLNGYTAINIFPWENLLQGKYFLVVQVIYWCAKQMEHIFDPNIYVGKYIYPSNNIFVYVDNNKKKYMGMFMQCDLMKGK